MMWNAEDYAKHSSVQARWAQELIGKLNLRGHESLLDIGCGDGKITAKISQALPRGQVVGIDASGEMIKLASDTFVPENYPRLSFRQMDAAAISLPELFDVAFSNAALHWVKDHVAVLKGVKAVLKPGGKILFQMGGVGNARDVARAVRQLISLPRWQKYFDDFIPPYHYYSVAQYQGWLAQCGLSAVRVELIPKDMQHQGAEGFKAWLRTTWFPYTDRLPVDARDTFLNDIVETYLQSHPLDAQGIVHLRMVRLEVEARRV